MTGQKSNAREGARSGMTVGYRRSSAARDWTPWKDRIRAHRDAVLYMALVIDSNNPQSTDAPLSPGGRSGKSTSTATEDSGRRCLLTASADGSARLFELSAAFAVPPVRRRLQLLQPPGVTARMGAHAAAAAAAAPGGRLPCAARGPSRLQSPPHPSPRGSTLPDLKPASAAGQASTGSTPFCTAFAYWGLAPSDSEPSQASQVFAAPQKETSAATLFGGYESGQIAGWSLQDGRLLVDLPGHELPITALHAISGDEENGQWRPTLLSTSHDGTLRGWHVRYPRGNDEVVTACVFVLDFGARNPVSDLLYLGSNQVLASSWDGALRCIDLERHECTNIVQASLCGVRCLVTRDGGRTVFAGTEECSITCWAIPANGAPAREVLTWKAHDGHVLQLRVWQNYLISASEDRSIRIWNPEKGLLLEELYGHSGAIVSSCVAVRESQLWTGSRDWSIRSWDLYDVGRRIEERDAMERMDREGRLQAKEWAKQARERRSRKVSPTKAKKEGRPARGK